MKHTHLALVALASALAFLACGSHSSGVDDPEMPLVGIIVQAASQGVTVAQARDERLGTIVYDTVGVRITAETEIFLQDKGGGLQPGKAEDLAAGDEIQFWTTGVEFRSLPPQVEATRIEVKKARTDG